MARLSQLLLLLLLLLRPSLPRHDGFDHPGQCMAGLPCQQVRQRL
jgi:hypothetical protein